ncbi:MAG: hypothetical protein LBC61_04825 [Candidatus Peribacteria bacterium]|nr:hypothetical protein [Candidatus Peribacteria bacterium]
MLNNGTKLNTDVFWRELFNILRTNDDFRRDVYFFEEINNRAGNRVIGGINTGIN